MRTRFGDGRLDAVSCGLLTAKVTATNIGNSSIGRITTTGTVTNYADPSISEPIGIAAGPDGALWFTNIGNNSIGRITTAGTVTNHTATYSAYPEDITAGPDGALWFTNNGGYSVGRITTAGTLTNYADSSISGPKGITAGPDGALWFTNSDNSSIGRIAVPTVPGAPTIGTATARNLRASVSFTGPANDGGDAITGFTASCTSSNGGVSGSASGAGSPIVVSGLTNGDAYRCTVTATNDIGTSLPSSASNDFVPAPTVPDPPTGVSAIRGNRVVVGDVHQSRGRWWECDQGLCGVV